jgi:dTDP-4-amino-4,6-dideoxygalactose transaminase
MPPGSGVAVPLFSDPSLPGAIIAAGHRPVFIDVHPENLTMDSRSLDRAAGRFSAVVIVHLFGHLADIPGLMAAAGNVPVIEDAAHAPLSFLNGRMAGHFGLASFFSFASTKYWPAGGGGLLAVHEPELAGRVAHASGALPAPSMARELGNLLLQGAKSAVFSRRLYGFLGRPMRRWAERLAILEPGMDMQAIHRSHAAGACRQASRFADRVERQRANSLRLLAELSSAEGVVLPRERLGARYNYHLFPVVMRDRDERDAVRNAMWSRFIDTSTIYSHAIDECRKAGYQGGCPIAESVASRLITLPNYADLSNREIDKVAEVFLRSLKACRAKRPSPAVSSSKRVSLQPAAPVETRPS